MTRIKKISSYIEDNEKVIDVGCDQALLSKLLAKRHIYSIASDVVDSIIERASENLTLEEKKYIDFRVGSGVTLNENETDYTLVTAGMGTYTILDIVKNSKVRFNKIITISNNHHETLRREMIKIGYYIKLEEIVKEKGKLYNMIIFDTIEREFTNVELIVGYNHQNIELLKERNNLLINKYKEILLKTNNDIISEKLKILANYNY
mgnify:FL=1